MFEIPKSFLKKIPGTRTVHRTALHLRAKYREYSSELQRRRDVRRCWKGSTTVNILETFPDYVANGWGPYNVRSQLTIKCVNQIPAALLSLSGSSPSPPEVTVDALDSIFDTPSCAQEAQKLAQLFTQYGSDKASVHNYFMLYAHILQQSQPVKKVMEIGLGTNNTDIVSTMGPGGRPGASLRAFRDFCPEASVFGADFDRRVLFTESRIKTFFVDQTTPESFVALGEQIGDSFDLMIDDGLHSANANLFSLGFFLPRLRPGGWAVIEDVAPAALGIWKVAARLLPTGYSATLVQCRSAWLVAVKRQA
jgi:hypothetical protein